MLIVQGKHRKPHSRVLVEPSYRARMHSNKLHSH